MNPPAARTGAPLRFVLLGALSFTTNLGVTAGLHELAGFSPDSSFAIGLATVFVINFAAMRWWVFPESGLGVARQLAGFAMMSAIFRSSEFLVFLLLRHVGDAYYLFAAGGALCLSMVVKYFVYGSWLFASSRR
jgi:putative flippase GtrA